MMFCDWMRKNGFENETKTENWYSNDNKFKITDKDGWIFLWKCEPYRCMGSVSKPLSSFDGFTELEWNIWGKAVNRFYSRRLKEDLIVKL